MRHLSIGLAILLITAVSLSSFAPSTAEAGTTTPAIQEEGDGFIIGPPPVSYTGSNGGAEELTMQTFPSGGSFANAGDGALAGNTWDFLVTGATPGGSGLIASSLAPGNVNAFGLSFLISIAPVNIVTYAYFGYGFGGDLYVPNVSQSVPALAGQTVFIQAYETAPVPRTSNGIAFTLTL